MKEPEYLRLKRRIEADYQRRLDALTMVWEMARDSDAEHRSRGTPRAGGVRQAVDAAVAAIPGEISVQVVERWIGQQHPDLRDGLKRPSLSQALKRLTNSGVLEVVNRGAGKRPTIYRKAK